MTQAWGELRGSSIGRCRHVPQALAYTAMSLGLSLRDWSDSAGAAGTIPGHVRNSSRRRRTD